MTLLITEIHNHEHSSRALIVFAADRRISEGTLYNDTRQKIFQIPALNAGIGYFGLAEVWSVKRTSTMEEWLTAYLSRAPTNSLCGFAERLATELNATVPKPIRQKYISGFHIAGFNNNAKPEFWFVRNVADDLRTVRGEYEPREDFQRRDAPALKPGESQVYRNGDIRAHVIAWEAIDKSLGSLLGAPHFKGLSTPDDYVDWVKFKMEVIAMLYERFCSISIIGRPIDAFPILCTV